MIKNPVKTEQEIQFSDFLKVDIRVGTIINAEQNLQTQKPAYKLEIDFGDIGIKKSSAQITDLYGLENLIGMQVIAVVNFPKKQIGKFMSEVLVLGLSNENGQIILIEPNLKVPNGARLH
jgi:tRNA-binding protein